MPTKVLNGSAAIARGIVESGVSVIAAYPGTPGTYTIDQLLKMPEAKKIDMQWSANEKVALEVAYGASLGGVRAVACMKGLGLNVALDTLMVINLAGSLGGLLIVVGDDPGAPGSSNEQDTRLLGAFAEIPIIEPAEVAETTQLVKFAFEISERLKTPVLFRSVREFARTKEEVALGKISPPQKAHFLKHKDLWKSLPQYAVSAHRKMHRKLGRAAKVFSNCQFNSIEGSGNLGIIACGFTFTRLKKVMEFLPQTKLRILKLSTVFPLPQGPTLNFLTKVKRVLVLEETEPFVERELNILAKKEGLRKPIFGKLTGHLPGEDETSAEAIFKAAQEFLGEKARAKAALRRKKLTKVSEAGFCDDCPFVPAFEGLVEVVKELKMPRPIVAGDPGCLIRLDRPPFEFLDVKMSLGASIGIAEGLKRAGVSQATIAITGDSAFMHTGLSAFASAAANGANLLLIILDNRAVVLTGLQPRIGTGHTARGKGKRVSLLRILRALGADFMAHINPEDKSSAKAAFRKALKLTGLRTIVLEAPCPLIHSKNR
jgi:indolepyruvate ferredoxin oxidoreductase alpha subunit